MQSEPNVEILVSDNASTDGTYEICAAIAASDNRVRLFRQACNIGASMNFRYLLDLANCEYFMWAAADDFHSRDFVESNLKFLVENPQFGGSTSPVQFVGGFCAPDVVGDKTIAQDCPAERIASYVDLWHRNSIFYGVYRTEVLRRAMWREAPAMGEDWIVIARILRFWKLKRIEAGNLFRSGGGASCSLGVFMPMMSEPLKNLFPLHHLTKTIHNDYLNVQGKQRMIRAVCRKLTRMGITMWLILGKRLASGVGKRALQSVGFASGSWPSSP